MINLELIKTKLICIFALFFFSSFFYVIICGFPMRQFKSILAWGDIIEYSKAAIMCISGLPLFLIVMIFFCAALFHKGSKILQFPVSLHFITSVIAVASLALGIACTVIFWIVINLSNYTLCDLPNTKSFAYFARDPAMCQAIHSKGFWGE
ncbi:hypothetical protein MUU46_02405 [Scandinavium sp. TWS1a]|uniref:hypothetical protein n=1 Tax=Scandinavium tedordense TaxID=2926521 RepID=UPI0021668065|nr:hypothetical protein [Scandinavium tedordense]MCS2169183.1 hypothetical protein [Scandinavium tedordense]